MNLVIIGGGSIGLLLAGSLAGACAGSLTLVVRTPRQAEAISRLGITVRDKEGSHPRTGAVACLSFEEYALRPRGNGEEAEWILLALKQKDIGPPVIEAIRKQASASIRLCCLQNGIGHLEKLQPAVGKNRLYAAVTTVGAMRVSDTEVWHTGNGSIRIGSAEAPGEAPYRPEAAQLADILTKAGLPALISPNIQNDIWDKLIINTVVNPLTAILDIKNGQLLDQPRCRELMQRLFEEAQAVAAAAGAAMPGTGRWEKLVEVCRSTADNRSSMLQDISAGRTTELEWLTGSLLREAERFGVKLPFHEAVFHLVKAKEELIASNRKRAEQQKESYIE